MTLHNFKLRYSSIIVTRLRRLTIIDEDIKPNVEAASSYQNQKDNNKSDEWKAPTPGREEIVFDFGAWTNQ